MRRMIGQGTAFAATSALTAAIFLLPATAAPEPKASLLRVAIHETQPVFALKAHEFKVLDRGSPSLRPFR